MLRKVLVRGAQRHGGMLAPLFLLVGIAMLCLLPVFVQQKTRIDENALGHMAPRFQIGRVDRYLDPTVRYPRRLVRGRRSPGSETVAVYVNSDYAASVAVANAVMEVVRVRDNMAYDVQFYFVKSAEEWPTPHAYARAAIVVNLSTTYSSHVCFDTLGMDGIQPNQDLANIAFVHASIHRLDVSYLCQKPGGAVSSRSRPFWHYWAYLESSIQLALHPQPWHVLPTHSINTLAISSDSAFSPVLRQNQKDMAEQMVGFVAYVLMSLNGLEEKLHHSTFVWLPVAMRRYVEYDSAQFCIILYVASIFSNAYAEYQQYSITITPLFVGLLLAPVGAAWGFRIAGWAGFAAASAASAIVCFWLLRHATSGMWMSFNCIALCLLIILQPACGLIAGCAAAVQLSFVHPLLQNRVVMAVGTAVSWLLYYYFGGYLQMPIFGHASVSELYISFVIYPNAVWITSRFLRLLF